MFLLFQIIIKAELDKEVQEIKLIKINNNMHFKHNH